MVSNTNNINNFPQTLSLGFSPCPNDTFIFDALVNNKLHQTKFNFNIELLDVETLNKKALNGDLDITKLSYHAYLHCANEYQILESGSALGRGCGPLLISKNNLNLEDIANLTIALPGELTTACLLFKMVFPKATKLLFTTFSNIEELVLNGTADAGVIIHENRFTYAQKGLIKLLDLGEFWETTTQTPIPLGAICIKRNLPIAVKKEITNLIKQSVEFAFKTPEGTQKYVQQHAQEMLPAVQQQHIALYVNEFSVNLGQAGKQAINTLFKKALDINLIPKLPENIFIDA